MTKWSKAQRAKFAATMKRKAAALRKAPRSMEFRIIPGSMQIVGGGGGGGGGNASPQAASAPRFDAPHFDAVRINVALMALDAGLAGKMPLRDCAEAARLLLAAIGANKP